MCFNFVFHLFYILRLALSTTEHIQYQFLAHPNWLFFSFVLFCFAFRMGQSWQIRVESTVSISIWMLYVCAGYDAYVPWASRAWKVNENWCCMFRQAKQSINFSVTSCRRLPSALLHVALRSECNNAQCLISNCGLSSYPHPHPVPPSSTPSSAAAASVPSPFGAQQTRRCINFAQRIQFA